MNAEARKLYIEQSLTPGEIAQRLNCSKASIYRYKKEALDAGIDWDKQRKVWNMSPRELSTIYAETVKRWIIELQEHPETLADPAIADAMTKHIAALQKINPQSQYLGIIIDFIREIDSWLRVHNPALQQQLTEHWEPIQTHLRNYALERGIR